MREQTRSDRRSCGPRLAVALGLTNPCSPLRCEFFAGRSNRYPDWPAGIAPWPPRGGRPPGQHLDFAWPAAGFRPGGRPRRYP